MIKGARKMETEGIRSQLAGKRERGKAAQKASALLDQARVFEIRCEPNGADWT
jgi:hypothetical protein